MTGLALYVYSLQWLPTPVYVAAGLAAWFIGAVAVGCVVGPILARRDGHEPGGLVLVPDLDEEVVRQDRTESHRTTFEETS